MEVWCHIWCFEKILLKYTNSFSFICSRQWKCSKGFFFSLNKAFKEKGKPAKRIILHIDKDRNLTGYLTHQQISNNVWENSERKDEWSNTDSGNDKKEEIKNSKENPQEEK